ncbi:alkyl sulfatase dimerization domain-containing protein [Bacillus sp. JJ722]|uniref:alkyl sulfatase dimerization domain-containing protein n=1 Tax=Bacillus sp. JJ722 TaxID=3122973 RepID=UPI003000E663
MGEELKVRSTHEFNPYMGGEVETVTLPNGAIVNKQIGLVPSKSEIIKVKDGIHVLSKYAIENTVIIDGKEGVIVWDTGSHMGAGQRKYQALRELTDKPIKAVIYSHSHYVMGTRAFVPEGPEGENIHVIAHPDLHGNVTDTAIELGPSTLRNGAQHFGFYLPSTGPDASLTAYFEREIENEDKSSGYVKPTSLVKDGEKMVIDGVHMQFFHARADTDDSIAVWLPDYDVVVTNNVWPMFPNISTLRGQPYRDPTEWIAGVDKIRAINPEFLITSHGPATVTREESYEYATYFRDMIAFVYSQTIRGINKGMRPDEIAERVKLPDHLIKYPRIRDAYGEFKHHLKGVYSGLIGWFSMDAADINPVPIPFRSKKIVEGFGGKEKIIEEANKSLLRKENAWAAELITHVLDIDPDNQEARQIKANALRQMGYVTPAISSRNFYLTQALVLEGKVDFAHIPPGFPGTLDEESMKKLPIENFVRLLEYKIDPEKSANIDKILSITFTDLHQEISLHVRRGVAECINRKPLKADMSIELSRGTWFDIIFGKLDVVDGITAGKVKVNGEQEEVTSLFKVFEL